MSVSAALRRMSPRAIPSLRGYAVAVAGSVVAIGASTLLVTWPGFVDVSIVFALAVLAVGKRWHTGPALLTAVLGFCAYQLLFAVPAPDAGARLGAAGAALAMLVATAVLSGELASRLALKVDALQQANVYSEAREALVRRLASATREDELLQAAEDALHRNLECPIWILVGDRAYQREGAEPPPAVLTRDMHRLDLEPQPAETVTDEGWWLLPLAGADRALGLVGIRLPCAFDTFDERRRILARAMTSDVSQALVRVKLAAELQSERVSHESQRLCTAMLSSVSHDMRSPLSSIIGAADSLHQGGPLMSADDRAGLLEIIRDEGHRLDRYVQHLVDMTRLGDGRLVVDRDWIGVDELIGAATARLQRYHPGIEATVEVEPGLAPLWVHPALMEQAVLNVLDNAAKFAPPGKPIGVRARGGTGGTTIIDILDNGPGIPRTERELIFDMFYTVGRGGTGHDGTGLGLAISQSIVRAHGGEMEALPGADGRGTLMRVVLPPPGTGEEAAP